MVCYGGITDADREILSEVNRMNILIELDALEYIVKRDKAITLSVAKRPGSI